LFSGANASYIPYDSAVPEILAYMYLGISRFGGSAVGLESSGTYQLPIRRTVQCSSATRDIVDVVIVLYICTLWGNFF